MKGGNEGAFPQAPSSWLPQFLAPPYPALRATFFP